MNLLYQQSILAILTLMGLIAVVNVLTFRSLRRGAHGASLPSVSVLLPARNEEMNIGLALSTLAEQDYPDFEVIVLDDSSDDATMHIAGQWTASNPRIRLLHGDALPEGWVGKSFACHQLAAAARGDLLLFVDADTVHTRQTLRSAVDEMQRSSAGLLTVIPEQTMVTFWERAILPLLHFTTFCFLPMPLVSRTRNSRLAMANGQFMLFRRSVYEAIGGHAAVREALVEDVWLSRLVKQHGFRLAIRDGGDLVSCRMYRSFAEIWNGFSKNLFAGFQYSLGAIAGVILFNLMTSVLPGVFFIVGIGMRATAAPWFLPIACQVAALVVIRLLLAVRFRLNTWSVVLHPLAMMIFIGIALNSCRWVLTKGGARWKGRVYNLRNSPIAQ